MRSRDAIVRGLARKLQNRLRRSGTTDCTVDLEPAKEIPRSPFRDQSPWIARITPSVGHEILISEEGIRVDEPEGTTVVEFSRVASWGWLASRTLDKRRDGHRIAARLEEGGEIIVHAPGWAWLTVYRLFCLVLPPEASKPSRDDGS